LAFMEIVSEIEKIVQIIKKGKFFLIAIDGKDGAGKSALAEKLLIFIDYLHINLDDLLDKNRGCFIDFIKYDQLERIVDQTKKPVIVEGICVLAVLKRINREPSLLIYVKRISPNGIWIDEKECDTESPTEIIEQKEKDLSKFARAEAEIENRIYDPDSCKISELTKEIIQYHHKYKPHKRADIVYQRVEL
jgi:uridine kinase